MGLTHETDHSVLLLTEALHQGLIKHSQLVSPPDEIEYRSIYWASNPSQEPNISEIIEYGIVEPNANNHATKSKMRRKVAIVAGLPTIYEEHLTYLTSDLRQDVICGFLGPFDHSHSSDQLCYRLLQASRRETIVERPEYNDKDFALAISYKHRNRRQIGGTLNDSDARILADALVDILKSVQGKKVWVWFDQQLANTVPKMDESKWYRFGAIPYLVLPVLRYVNSSMLGKTARPWLLFEEYAAHTGCGFWSAGKGMLPQDVSEPDNNYAKAKYDKYVLSPGMAMRWSSALIQVLKNFWRFRWDALLEGYEYKQSYREFISWATLYSTLQFVPDKTKLPWFYRLEISFSSLLDASKERILTDVEAWSNAHLKLKDYVRNKAAKLLLLDDHDGDSLRPAFTESGFLALRLFNGLAISQENEKLKLVVPNKENCSVLQKLAAIGTFRYRILTVIPNVARVYYPATGDLQLDLVKMPADVFMLVLELASVITAYKNQIKTSTLQTGDWPCYASYLAFMDMDTILWDQPIYYIWRGQARLLQVELVVRDIIVFDPALKLQTMITWKQNLDCIRFVRRCASVQVFQGYGASLYSVYRTVYKRRKVRKPVTGVFCDGDSDAIKGLLGLLKPDQMSALHPCSAIVQGSKGGEEFINASDMDLRKTGHPGEYVCGVNSLRCRLSKSVDPKCQWRVTWGDPYEMPLDELSRAELDGTVGADSICHHESITQRIDG